MVALMFETISNFGTITIFSRKRPRVLILMQILSVRKQGDVTATVENGRSWGGPIIQMIQKTVKLEPTGYYDPNL